MKRSWTITLLRHEQPSDQAWSELERVVADWNAGDGPPFQLVADFMRLVSFDEATRPRMEVLLRELERVERETGAVYDLAARQHLDDEDYARADLIGILGQDLTLSPPFLLDDEELSAAQPCPECGWADPLDAPLAQPLTIDESRLDEPAADGTEPGPDGWDLANLPNGHILVSRRVQSILRVGGVRGYELHEVLGGSTGRPSKRVARLTATTAVLTPCPEHSTIAGDPFCPRCGTAHGKLDGFFWVRSDVLGDRDVISRHPGLGAMLHVRRRVFGLLEQAELSGLHRTGVLMVCDHGGEA